MPRCDLSMFANSSDVQECVDVNVELAVTHSHNYGPLTREDWMLMGTIMRSSGSAQQGHQPQGRCRVFDVQDLMLLSKGNCMHHIRLTHNSTVLTHVNGTELFERSVDPPHEGTCALVV